jgi:hypothetical protein
MSIRHKKPPDELESMSLSQKILRISLYKMYSKIHISCSHLQMELNCDKTPSVSLVMHTEFVSTIRDCRASTKN